MQPLVLINAVGLTPRLLSLAPRLQALAEQQGSVSMIEPLPAVTCTAQAAMLTGEPTERHGIVGNGWLFRDTTEVRFWQQSNRLLQAEPVYATIRRRAAAQGRAFRCAKLFWWFNQGADVALSVTPKPQYGLDGRKVFDIQSSPPELAARLTRTLGSFPFFTFWGPKAGLPCTRWIAAAAADLLRHDRPDLTLAYLPHLDYDPQRFGPAGSDLPRLVRELDDACAPLLDAASAAGAAVWVVSEYGHVDVSRPVELNRILRRAGLVEVRPGPFGEQLDLHASQAFAVCDHQLAHVYVRSTDDRERVADLLRAVPGVAQVLVGAERTAIDLNHERAGDLVVLSEPDAWFAYPFWLDDAQAPDYARAVAIHHKPGYDPCELFVDPALWWPTGRVAWRLAQKVLGFRMIMDVIPLENRLVRGSHGLRARHPAEGALWIGDGSGPAQAMTSVARRLLEHFEATEDS